VKQGRKGLEQQDFADEANSAIGKPNNPGWKLDKWKFLPMAQASLRHKPDAKWFVFIEADTYVSWPTILAWLARFDPRKPHYLGTETQIADVIFAHGGSGFVLSNPALQRASDQYSIREVELNEYTNQHWAGDCVLGKVLADAGVNLHFTWPILQNSNLGELDEFTVDFLRRPWCFIAVAFHHLSPIDIENLWKFEQKRWRDVSPHFTLSYLMFHTDHVEITEKQTPPPSQRPLPRIPLPRNRHSTHPTKLGQCRKRRPTLRENLRRLSRNLRSIENMRAILVPRSKVFHIF
jgi:hypothetical protein